MKREEWVDREIRTVVQGIHHVLGVGGPGDTPVSPLTISGDPPGDEETAEPASPLAEDAASGAAAPAPETSGPAVGARRTARRKRKRDRR